MGRFLPITANVVKIHISRRREIVNLDTGSISRVNTMVGEQPYYICVFKRGQKLPIFEATLLMDGPTSIDKLSEQQKSDVVNFMNIFSRIYPCTHCADDLKVDLGSDFLEKNFSLSLKFFFQERN